MGASAWEAGRHACCGYNQYRPEASRFERRLYGAFHASRAQQSTPLATRCLDDAALTGMNMVASTDHGSAYSVGSSVRLETTLGEVSWWFLPTTSYPLEHEMGFTESA